jgi:hypothetical protein
MNLHPSLRVYSYSGPARGQDLVKLAAAYPAIPNGYLDLVREATNVTLLWNNQGELRIWGPDEVFGMDTAYGASARMPGSIPFADNGGGEWLVYGDGQKGRGVYLVDTGSLDLDEYAPWVCNDLHEMLTEAAGADLVFKSDPIDEAELGQPFYTDPPAL